MGTLSEYYVHVYMRADGLCGCVTCDAEYPPRVAFSLLTRLLEDFSAFKPDWAKESRNEAVSWPQLESDVVKYQDPANADQIMKIQRSLDETRDVLHNTIGRSDNDMRAISLSAGHRGNDRPSSLVPVTAQQIACSREERSWRTWWSARES